MADLNDLSKTMRRLQRQVVAESERGVKEAAKAVVNHLVYNTAVDTSKAISNWQAKIGSATSGTRDAIFKGSAGSTRQESADAARTRAEGIIDGFKSGQTIHITNNLPYIEGLNNGTISQQASGFVEGAIVMGKQAANNFKAKLNG